MAGPRRNKDPNRLKLSIDHGGWLPPLSNFRGCVALGRIFGTTFLASPPSALSSCSTASGLWTRAGRGRGRAFRKVVPKFLPRATQTPNFPPGGCGLRGGGGSVCESRQMGSLAFPLWGDVFVLLLTPPPLADPQPWSILNFRWPGRAETRTLTV